MKSRKYSLPRGTILYYICFLYKLGPAPQFNIIFPYDDQILYDINFILISPPLLVTWHTANPGAVQ